MHDSEQVVVYLEDFDLCPVWWQHMVNHLVEKHSPWHMQDTHQIIQDYLMCMYQAHYVDAEQDGQKNMVQFPNKLSYCECVLQWDVFALLCDRH
jgi:hypothetical protein